MKKKISAEARSITRQLVPQLKKFEKGENPFQMVDRLFDYPIGTMEKDWTERRAMKGKRARKPSIEKTLATRKWHN